MLALLHFLCALVELALYALLGAATLTFLMRARWARRRGPLPAPTDAAPPAPAPFVVVQLPLRNEPRVAEGLLRAAAALDWPRDRLRLQILDDSDDETVAIVDRVATELRTTGVAIDVVRRHDRRGYKAGALARGMRLVRADRFLILDADFRPEPTLLAALEAGLGEHAFCQARWSFRNRDPRLLTQLQAAILDALFAVEQAALGERGEPVPFNGTAGLWRREAIVRAGGWDVSDDALTEDLDLSYRAHEVALRGVTQAELSVSTELPASMAAFRGQQMRWVRGAGLTLRSLGRRLLRRATFGDARGMLAHLLRHARQPVFTAAAVRLVVVALGGAAPVVSPWLGVPLFLITLGATALYLGEARRRIDGDARAAAKLAPALFALSMGLAPALAMAFVGGALGRRGRGFVRTEKHGDATATPRTSALDGSAIFGLVISVATLVASALFVAHHDVLGALAAFFVAVSCAWVALAP